MKIHAVFAVLLAIYSTAGSSLARADAADLTYFQQFLYSEKVDADGNTSTQFLMSTAPQGAPGFTIGTNAQGQTVDATVDLFLMKDGTFTLKYMEMTSTGMPITFPFFIHFTGNWSVPDNQLIVGDVAIGTRGVYDGRNAVQLTFPKDLHSAGLVGKTAILDFGFSNETPVNP